MRNVWHMIFWKKVTDKAGMFYGDRATIWKRLCGTEYREDNKVMAHVLMDQCPEREVLQLNTVVTGRLRVQRTRELFFHWQLSMDTHNILISLVSVKQVGLSP